MQGYGTLHAPAEIFALCNGGTDSAGLYVASYGELRWSDGSTVDPYLPGVTEIASIYDSSVVFDTTTRYWLLVAMQGAGLTLVHQADYLVLDTLLSDAVWCILRRIEDCSVIPIPQV